MNEPVIEEASDRRRRPPPVFNCIAGELAGLVIISVVGLGNFHIVSVVQLIKKQFSLYLVGFGRGYCFYTRYNRIKPNSHTYVSNFKIIACKLNT